ncbi:protein mono-ADP-ribosyltransferase PARP11-like, partial [Hyalella azteca]|uniref:Poly [ADP-ribose] polymerase n=1 Tax=Hyalella azteca TaxID=294128 RepID=A0A8B7P6X8_HYAAZ
MGYKWQFKDEHGKWIDYGEVSSDSFLKMLLEEELPQVPRVQECFIVPISRYQAKHAKVLALLKPTYPNGNPIRISKINNPYLPNAFQNKKVQIQYPSVQYREQCLFHGTDSKNVNVIAEKNIDWRLLGSSGKAHCYGRGAYFSDKSNLPIDTTVDDTANPEIFVKYDTQEYYPVYYALFGSVEYYQ